MANGFVQSGKKNIIKTFNSLEDFPQVGKNNIFYFEKNTENTYKWDDLNTKYVKISNKPEDVSTEQFYQKYIMELKNFFEV